MTGSDDGQLSKLSPLGGAIFNSIHWTSSPAPECPQHLAGRFTLVWIEPLAWSVIPIPAADLDCHDDDRPDLVTTHQDRLQTPIPKSLAFCASPAKADCTTCQHPAPVLVASAAAATLPVRPVSPTGIGTESPQRAMLMLYAYRLRFPRQRKVCLSAASGHLFMSRSVDRYAHDDPTVNVGNSQ